MTQSTPDHGSNAMESKARLAPDRHKQDEDGLVAIGVAEPLEGLEESERLFLAIKFGTIRMCAALTHGHSFESSIFRLPAKCLACQELVWGPFTRGCVCLVCKATAHRSCTGRATMPKCPTKDLFIDFCRSELDLRLPAPAASAPSDGQEGVLVSATEGKFSSATSSRASQDRIGGGDLDGWATVEEAAADDSGKRRAGNRDSAFSWSPFGSSDRKRPLFNNNDGQQQHEASKVGERAEGVAARDGNNSTNAKIKSEVISPLRDDPGDLWDESSGATKSGKVHGADPPTATIPTNAKASVGIRDVGKMSVAGGVVGAVLGGPAGAVVGLKLGAVVGAGRWSVQGLWQRIEKEQQAAGAAAGLAKLPKALDSDNTATGIEGVEGGGAVQIGVHEFRDVWARIAHQVEKEEQPSTWELDPEQEDLLEQGECDAVEVATFVVSKLLADETALPNRLYKALLGEFRSRHRLCDFRRPSRRRRSGATDMVALFPRAGGSFRGLREDGSGESSNGGGSNPAFQDGSTTAILEGIPGLEKTFSFVEETEIVEGEESDAASGDFMENEYVNSIGEDERMALDACEVSAWTPRKSGGGSKTFAPAARPALAATVDASKDSTQNNSCRLDSWVRLEGDACGISGSRITGVPSQSRLASDCCRQDEVEDNEDGLEYDWASTEAPSCSCAEEGILSASPEVIDGTTLNGVRGGGGSCGPASAVGDENNLLEDTIPLHESEGRDGADQGKSAIGKNGREATTSGSGCESRAGKAGATAVETGQESQEEVCDALRDVHGVLRELTRAVLSWCPILTTSDEAAIQAVNCIDQRVLGATYGPVYARIASGQTGERDNRLAQRVAKEELVRKEAGRPFLAATCEAGALAALSSAGAARTGRDKLEFLVQAVERISASLPSKSPTDTLIWCICRHLAAAMMDVGGAEMKARGGRVGRPLLPRPHAEVAFVEQFARDESWLMGKQGYVLTTVDAALHVLLDPTMSDEVFLDSPATVEGGSTEAGAVERTTLGSGGS